MFSGLAPRYRDFNRWASLGMDQRWRRVAVREIAGSRRVLDVGAGTGELTALAAKSGARVVGIDISAEMLHGARRRDLGRAWIQASGDNLPFRSGSFDAVISAYVFRNLFRAGILEASLREARRVLAPGGKLVFLDLTKPGGGFLRWGHGLYNRTVLPALGRWFFGALWPGEYLAASIEALPPAEALHVVFQKTGFESFRIRPLWGGVVSLFIGSAS